MSRLAKIKNFPNYYITDSGDIYSVNYLNKKRIKRIKKLKPIKKTTGYYCVWLCNNTKHFNKLIHRLVAEAFIPNPLCKKTVNHKNGIKTDNRVENLEWCTYSENILHAFKTGLKASPKPWLGKFGKDNHRSKPVLQIKNELIIAEFYGLSEASRTTGISISNICHCCKGLKKSAGGYKWKYKTY